MTIPSEESAARVEDGVDLRMLAKRSVSWVIDSREIVIAVVEWATGDLLPLVGRQGLRHALHAVIHVGGGRSAGLDAIGASVGLERHRLLGDGFADLFVDRADVSGAKSLVGRQQIAVPGDDRNISFLRPAQDLGDRRGVGGGDADAVNMLGDEVLHDLDL